MTTEERLRKAEELLHRLVGGCDDKSQTGRQLFTLIDDARAFLAPEPWHPPIP